MKRMSSFRFSKKSIFLMSLMAVLLTGGIFAVSSYLPVAKAGDGNQGAGGRDDGNQGTGGRNLIGSASYDQFSKADATTAIVRSPAQTAYRVAIASMAD